MITMRLIPDSGEAIEVTAGTRDVYTWEKTSRTGKTFASLQDNPSIVAMYEIAWFAARRQGLIPQDMTQQSFVDTFELESEEDDTEDAGPFPGAPSPATSSPSPSPPVSRRGSGSKKATGR